MKKSLLSSLTLIFFDQANIWRLMLLSVFGYAFSLSVILSTIGIMDGFEASLKSGLKLSAGDALLTSKNGFFEFSEETLQELQFHGVQKLSTLVQAEAFAVSSSQSQGVLVRGVDKEEFASVTGLNLNLENDQDVVLGESLVRRWKLSIGDDFTLMMALGGSGEAPQLLRLKLSGFVRHGIHEKDMRFVYVKKSLLQEVLGVRDRFNMALLILSDKSPFDLTTQIRELGFSMGTPWIIKPSWQEFASLLEAVEVEKRSIAIVLQLIVVVAVFNIAAFLVSLRSRKLREFFLIRALGMPLKKLYGFSFLLLVFLWGLSCLGAVYLVKLFDYVLQNASFLQIPGEIYVIDRLKVILSFQNYFLVFSLAFVWMMVLGVYGLFKLRKQTLISGLRMEFQ
jgi:lipoprotein-releasing system permease protein